MRRIDSSAAIRDAQLPQLARQIHDSGLWAAKQSLQRNHESGLALQRTTTWKSNRGECAARTSRLSSTRMTAGGDPPVVLVPMAVGEGYA